MKDLCKIPSGGRSGRSLKRTSLHHETVLRLRDMIENGELPPDSRIPELELCDMFEISRTPLREALKVLASEGLVVHVPNRGFRVSSVDPQEIEAIFELMGALEELAGRLVCERASDDDIQELEHMHKKMARYHHQGQHTLYFQINQDIHRFIIDHTANPALSTTYASFSTRIARARSLANYSQLRWDESLAEHEQLMAALSRRDATLMSRLLREHNDNTAKEVLRELKALPPAGKQVSGAEAFAKV